MHVPQTVIRLRVCYAERRELMLTDVMGAQRPGWLLPFTSRPCFRVCSFPLETAPPTRGREDVGHGVIRSAPNAPPRRQRERRTGTPRPVHREDGIHSSSEGPHLLPLSQNHTTLLGFHSQFLQTRVSPVVGEWFPDETFFASEAKLVSQMIGSLAVSVQLISKRK